MKSIRKKIIIVKQIYCRVPISRAALGRSSESCESLLKKWIFPCLLTLGKFSVQPQDKSVLEILLHDPAEGAQEDESQYAPAEVQVGEPSRVGGIVSERRVTSDEEGELVQVDALCDLRRPPVQEGLLKEKHRIGDVSEPVHQPRLQEPAGEVVSGPVILNGHHHEVHDGDDRHDRPLQRALERKVRQRSRRGQTHHHQEAQHIRGKTPQVGQHHTGIDIE